MLGNTTFYMLEQLYAGTILFYFVCVIFAINFIYSFIHHVYYVMLERYQR